jgi:hypothetical protein
MSRSSLVTQRYPEEEKISWNMAGEDAESLDEILLGKSDYLISGILAEESSRDHFSNVCDSQKQPEEKKVDISLMRLRNRQQGHLLMAGSGQRLRGKRWGNFRMGGVINGGICAYRVERTIATETNTTTGT